MTRSTVSLSMFGRLAIVVLVSLAGVVFFTFVGVYSFGWARECSGGLDVAGKIAFSGPGVVCVVAIDYWLLRRTVTFWRVAVAVAAAAAAVRVLGYVFSIYDWGCR